MATSSTPATKAVPMGQKIAFGFGMLANQMFPAALGVFIIVLVQDLGFAAMLWGIIQFLPRIFDAITDPIMGFISDNTRSKYGRRRQYVFIGAILMGIAYIAMWQLHKHAPDDPKPETSINIVQSEDDTNETAADTTIGAVPSDAGQNELQSDTADTTQRTDIGQFKADTSQMAADTTIGAVPSDAGQNELQSDTADTTQRTDIGQFKADTSQMAADTTMGAAPSEVGKDALNPDTTEDRVWYNFFYFLGWSLVFYLGLTIFSVPYVAMGYEISEDFHERTQIMAVAQFIGQWAWVIAPWFWVILYDPSWFPEGADAGVRKLSIWVAIPCTLFALVPALFIKSKSTLDRTDFAPINATAILRSVGKIFTSAFEAFRIKQFRQIAGATFLIFNSFNVIASYTFLIIVHYLFNSDPASAGIWPAMHGSVGALITTFLVIPLVTQMSKVLGKKRAFIVCQLISIVGYIYFWFLFVPGEPHLFLLALPFHSFGIGSLFTIMMSMTADVCDLDELKTGKRREGVLGAVYWWMVKLGFGVAALLSGFFLSTVGFDAENVTESAVTGMRLFYTLFPIAGVIGAIWIMWNYDITEERAAQLKEELAQKRAELASKA